MCELMEQNRENSSCASSGHYATLLMIRNRIVKRQGALPPWIELQNNLDSALTAFRSTLLSTYTTHLVRDVISTTSIVPLPPVYTIPSSDPTWEARERKFHEENVRQINDLVRRMNAVAPSIVRRPLITLDVELNKVRGDTLRQSVWDEIRRRAEEVQTRPEGRFSEQYSIPSVASTGLSPLRRIAQRSLYTLAAPVSSILRKATGGGMRQGRTYGPAEISSTGAKTGDGSSSGVGVAIVVGLGVGSYLLSRRPLQNDSEPMEEPIASPAVVVARSPNEERTGIIGALQRYILEPILTFFRFLHLFLLFGPVIVTSPMLLVGQPSTRRRPGKPVAQEEENWGAVWWYAFLVKQMERAGPSFIKLGQWAASRADLFPASLCERMSKLHSNGKPHSLRHTKKVISEAFGMDFADIFEEFGEEPIGCGAIAQVS